MEVKVIRKKYRRYMPGAIKRFLRENVKKHLPVPIQNASCKADIAYKSLLSGNTGLAHKQFAQALNVSGYRCKEKLALAFHLVAAVYTGQWPETLLTQPDIYEVKESVDFRPLLLEGMICSGNGALRDYFAQFGDISELDRGNKTLKFLRSFHGIHDLTLSADSPADFRQKMIIFFGKHIAGLATPGSFMHLSSYEKDPSALSLFGKATVEREDLRAIIQARENMLSEMQENVLNNFIAFLFLFRKGDRDKNPEKILADHLEKFIKGHIAAQFSNLQTDLVALRNLFKLDRNNLSVIRYLKDYWYLASFRDPRAQFVNLRSEGYDKSVEEFTAHYKIIRRRFEDNYNRGYLIKDRTVKVQFERLVLKEDYRNSIARKVGVNPQNIKDNIIFDPSQSFNNLYIYENYQDRTAMDYIGRELQEYLYAGR